MFYWSFGRLGIRYYLESLIFFLIYFRKVGYYLVMELNICVRDWSMYCIFIIYF